LTKAPLPPRFDDDEGVRVRKRTVALEAEARDPRDLEIERLREELAQARAEIARLSSVDQLSGALNRPAIIASFEEEVLRAERYARPLAIALFNLDHFSLVNDYHGHASGDEVIRRFAATCLGGFRATDRVGRMDGEEFLVVLPEGSLEAAADAAERTRKALAAERFKPGADSVELPFSVTASAGVAALEPGQAPDELLARADAALHRAKSHGRNRVELNGRKA
jgi:diguanylate cyclase (GGDEF)-like protein